MLDTRAKILQVACEIYLEAGTKGLSMRKVAQKAGISATAIYRHFENKEELHRQVLTDGFRTFGTYLYPALSGPDPLARLHLAAEGFFRFATEQPRFYELMFLTMDHSEEISVKDILANEAQQTYDFMIDRVRDCMAAGQLREDDPEEIAMLLLSVCNGFFGLYVSHKFQGSLAEMKALYERTYRRIMQGLSG